MNEQSKKRGRPKLNKGKMKTIAIRMLESDYDKLAEEAKSQGRKTSELARTYILYFL